MEICSFSLLNTFVKNKSDLWECWAYILYQKPYRIMCIKYISHTLKCSCNLDIDCRARAGTEWPKLELDLIAGLYTAQQLMRMNILSNQKPLTHPSRDLTGHAMWLLWFTAIR